MNSTLRGLLTLGLVSVAGLGGYWLGSHRTPSAPPPPATATNQVSRLPKENVPSPVERGAPEPARAAPMAEPAKPATAAAVANSTRLDQTRILAQVQKEKFATVYLPAVGRDGKVTNGFATLFELTEAERQTLQQAVDHGRRRTEELMAAGMTVKEEADKLVFAMKPFEGGAEVYDAVMDAFAQTLGPERNAAFVALQTDDFSRTFGSFGAEQRTVTFSRELPPDGGTPRILIVDQRNSADGASSSMSTAIDQRRIPGQYPWLAPYLPKIVNLPAKPRAAGGGRP